MAVAADIYRITLADQRIPVLTAHAGTRLWFLDQRNGINVLDMLTGAVYAHEALPRDASIAALAASDAYLFAVDSKKPRLFVYSVREERLSTVPLASFTGITAAAVAPDGVLWLGTGQYGALLRYQPSTGRLDPISVGLSRIAALASDVGGHIWASDGRQLIARYDVSTGAVVRIAIPTTGMASVLLPDLFGHLWVGTTTGEIFAVEREAAALIKKLDRPVTALASGPHGRVWYLAPASGAVGFAFGTAATEMEARLVPGAVSGFALNPRGRVWFTDPSGAFYLALEGRQP